ncbi:MAG: multicopper oxidase domain-containing protein [Methanospirillum sp.]
MYVQDVQAFDSCPAAARAVMDCAGTTTFHCHILEHEKIEMMGLWHIMDAGMPP